MHHSEIERQSHNQLPDFEFGDYQRIPAFLDGLEWYDRSRGGVTVPMTATGFFPLGIDGNHPGKHQHEQRTEQHQGGYIAVGNQMDKRPHRNSPQERMPGYALYTPRGLISHQQVFSAHSHGVRRRHPQHGE